MLGDLQICSGSVHKHTQSGTEAERRRTEKMEPTFKGKPGDLIEIRRRAYQHWAVYIGEDEVVHFVPEGGDSSSSFELLSSSGEVKREKLTDVVKGDSYQVKNLLDEKYEAHDPSIIVKEACAMVGRVLQYDLVSYNCEHFATEMRFGKPESRQVKRATWIAVASAVLLFFVVFFVGNHAKRKR